MIERKLIPGRFIHLPFRPVAQPDYTKGDFVPLPPLQLTIQQSTGLIKKTSRIIQGTGRREHRNFQWLAYFAGAITEVSLGGLDVLTGRMTGCWLVIYRKPPSGVVTVAHIGTEDSSTTGGTVAVKRTWNTFASNYPNDVIAGFRPSDAWRDLIPPVTSQDSGAEIYGLVTTDRRLYSIFTYIQGGSDLKLLRIAGIQEMESAERRDLTNL